jgi:hypothetical protein
MCLAVLRWLTRPSPWQLDCERTCPAAAASTRREAVKPECSMSRAMDITVTLHIAKPPATIARTMFDANKDSSWIGGVLKVEFLVGCPMSVGGRVRRLAMILGRPFSCVTEVIAHGTIRSLVMRFVEGPLRGEVSYDIVPTLSGSVVRIRNTASPRFVIPGMGWLLRRSVRADLRRLKSIVEDDD